MFPINTHTSPALLPILLMFQYKGAIIVIHTPSLLTDSGINNNKRRVVSQVEVFSMPGRGEETSRG